jgi:two-component system, OmpR family, response regulator
MSTVQGEREAALRVLVVEDDEPIRVVLRLGLAAEVLEAPDGPSALALLERESVDVVLLDVMLPHMSGLEVLEQIRAGDATQDLPVVMLTSQRTDHSHHNAYCAGADAYVTKPFDPYELDHVLKGLLDTTPEERRAARVQQQRLSALLDQIEASFGS